MGSLSEFQELINDIKDEHLLEVAEGLLRDLVEMQNMKEKIEKLEETLSEGDRAAFWWFAMGLDREQVDLATNSVIGRKRFLKEQADRVKLREEANAPRPEGEIVPKKQYKKAKPLPAPFQVPAALIAQARSGMSVEESLNITDQEIEEMIMNNERGLGKLLSVTVTDAQVAEARSLLTNEESAKFSDENLAKLIAQGALGIA